MRYETFEVLIGGERVYLLGSIQSVVEYFQPGHPILRAVKVGVSTWDLRVGRKRLGSAQRLR